MASSPLKALSSIISSGVETIESTYARNGAPYPSLDEPFSPDLISDPRVAEATSLVIAAAAQLIATIRMPAQTLLEGVGGMHLTAALGSVNALHIAEVLREAGPQGLHVNDIGKCVGSDPSKIGRILRYLATRHIFREVFPDVFAANRISSLIDTGKSIEEIKANPEEKNHKTSGLSAVIGHFSDESMKGGAYLPEYIVDEEKASSQEPNVTPMNLAFNTPLSLFDFVEQPGNEERFRRLGFVMQGVSSLVPADSIVKGFDWSFLKKDEVVVDVGGGVGSVTLALAKAYPQLKYVVQDRPTVVPDGNKFWKAQFPEALESEQVMLEAHDIFKPQPIKDASVFLLRLVVHDWSDKYVKQILSNLRTAARPSTKLILVEHIVPYAAPSSEQFSNIPGAEVPTPPSPLLPNLGIVNSSVFLADFQMLLCANSLERTVGQFIEVVDGTGWKLDHITRGGPLSHLVFVPI